MTLEADNEKIHAVVQGRYSQIVLTGGNCCGPADSGEGCCSPVLYQPGLLSDLPESVTGLSLGCGDPVSLAGIAPGETVLDLGSGAGIDCFLAMRQVGPQGHVIGVDMTPEMIGQANANREKVDAQNVEFRLGQIEALPVEDSVIDLIISNCVINLVPDKVQAFREMWRVLRPGGRLSISDIVTEGEFSPEQRAELSNWAECVTGAVDAEIYRALLAEVGFTGIGIADKTSAEAIVPRQDGMPALFSARITAYKPR